MRKWNTPWRRVPRAARILLDLLLTALLLFLLYIFSGCPSFTAEQAYRRAARANLVGPGEVLGVVETKGDGYDRLLLARTEEGVVLYSYIQENVGIIRGHTGSSFDGRFYYRNRGGPLTLLAAPVFLVQESIDLPVILFDEYPRAVRAKLYLHLYDDEDTPYNYHLEAERGGAGYFVFSLKRDDLSDDEAYAIELLSEVCVDDFTGNLRRYRFPAVVRLYDAQGQVVAEETITLRSIAAEAHDRQEQ